MFSPEHTFIGTRQNGLSRLYTNVCVHISNFLELKNNSGEVGQWKIHGIGVLQSNVDAILVYKGLQKGMLK